MTADDGFGKAAMEVEKEGNERGTLLERAGVLGLAVGIQAAFVADADGAAVEGTAMGTYLVKATVLGDGAVFSYIVMIAYVDEASLQVVVLELLGGVVAGLAGGGAVDDDEAY